MKLHPPMMITSRLMAGLKIGEAWVGIEDGGLREGRQAYRYAIDLPDYSYVNDDLSFGMGGGTLQQGLSSLMTFLGVFAEARRVGERWGGPESDNWGIFPDELAEWTMENADEIGMLGCELEESTLIEE